MAMLSAEQKLGTLLLDDVTWFVDEDLDFLEGLESDRLQHVPDEDHPEWQPTRQQDDELTRIYNRIVLGQK